jgi:hypothetical protein
VLLDEINALSALLISCALLGYYLIRTTTAKDKDHIKEDDIKEETKEIIKPIGLTFQFEFIPQKDGSLMGVKYINSARFGMVKVTVYKGVQYSDNGLNYIEIKKGTNVVSLDEMTDNDLILIFTLIKKT